MGIRRQVAFRFAMSDRFEALVAAVPGARERSYQRARRYVAGATLDEALDVARDLLRQGSGVSLDAFGELVRDPAEAAQAAEAYAALIDGAAALDGDVWVSVDLRTSASTSHPPSARTQLRRITERLPAGMRLQVGAEDAARCDAILDIVEEAAGRGDALTCTLQANLRRSMADTERIASLGMPVRLVKGAFVEPAAVAYPYGPETDTAATCVLARGAGRASAPRCCSPTHDTGPARAAGARSHLEMLLGVHDRARRPRLARTGTGRANLRTVRSDVVPLLHAPLRRGAGLVTTRRSP